MSKSISKFVKSQFPKYILETDSMFPYFMEAYYEWMSNKDNPNGLLYELDGISNVDEKYSNFVDEFISEYIDIIPEEIASDKQLLIKKITELYQTKGTNKSIKLLFRILFDTDISIIDPSENIFKVSAATYIKPKAILFNITSGNITKYKDVNFSILGKEFRFDYIRKVGNDIYEGILQNNIDDVYIDGFDIVGDEFTGSSIKTITGKKIIKRGVGFKVGDIYHISTADGNGTIIKVTRVNGTSLRGFDIIKFGTGYLTDFNYRLSSTSSIGVIDDRNLSVSLNGDNTQYISNDYVDKLIDDYKISRFTYLQDLDYFEDNSYVGKLIKSGQTEVTGNQLQSSENDAEILFTLGYIYEYPGYYASGEGIVSDTSKLHDGEYWQQFSYVIRSDRKYSEYKDVVKRLVHPAGLKMFSEYSITNKIDLLVDVKTYLDTFNSILVDSSKINDEVQRKDFIKNIIYDSFDLDINGNSDGLIINSAGDIADIGPGYEKFNVLEQIAIELQRAAIELNVNNSDDATISLFKELSELQNVAETLVTTFNKYLTDNTLTFEAVSRTITKNVMVRKTYPVEYKYSAEAIAMSSDDILSVGNDDVFGTENIDSELILSYSLDQIMMSETDTLDLGNGETFSTYAGEYVEEDETYSNLAANIIFDLDVGGGITLAIPNTNIVITEDDALLITDDEEFDSFRARNIGGVFLNPYYSSTELINNNIPYWHYGYTINERIIQ